MSLLQIQSKQIQRFGCFKNIIHRQLWSGSKNGTNFERTWYEVSPLNFLHSLPKYRLTSLAYKNSIQNFDLTGVRISFSSKSVQHKDFLDFFRRCKSLKSISLARTGIAVDVLIDFLVILPLHPI